MHVNHSQINSSKKCGFESHDRTKGFHRKTARQNRSQTNNHHLRQSFIWQLSLCGNYTLIFDPENAPYRPASITPWLHAARLPFLKFYHFLSLLGIGHAQSGPGC